LSIYEKEYLAILIAVGLLFAIGWIRYFHWSEILDSSQWSETQHCVATTSLYQSSWPTLPHSLQERDREYSRRCPILAYPWCWSLLCYFSGHATVVYRGGQAQRFLAKLTTSTAGFGQFVLSDGVIRHNNRIWVGNNADVQ
jgi:hypothetical protein